MIKFLKAAFSFTLFELVLFSTGGLLKYLLNYYHVTAKIQTPFIWICVGAGIVFVIAVSIRGILENKGQSIQELKKKESKTSREKWILFIAEWGYLISVCVGYLLFLYIIMPDTWSLLIAALIGMILAHISHYVQGEKNKSEESEQTV